MSLRPRLHLISAPWQLPVQGLWRVVESGDLSFEMSGKTSEVEFGGGDVVIDAAIEFKVIAKDGEEDAI